MRKIQYNSPVILTYTILSFMALAMGFATNNLTTRLFFSVYASPLSDPLFYFRLFGHVLGHANFAHFFNNFMLILLIGPILEEKYGSKGILFMIMATAFITGVLNCLFFDTALLGASGVAFMFIILGSFVSMEKGRIPLTFILVVSIFIGNEIVTGIISQDNISQITHVVGGVCGAIIGFLVGGSSNKKPKKNETYKY